MFTSQSTVHARDKADEGCGRPFGRWYHSSLLVITNLVKMRTLCKHEEAEIGLAESFFFSSLRLPHPQVPRYPGRPAGCDSDVGVISRGPVQRSGYSSTASPHPITDIRGCQLAWKVIWGKVNPDGAAMRLY